MARYSIVKRQRKYYKDGVEVPSSSITDFGRTKYYKNVVTTKYWKEITTGSRELEYYCYYYDGILGGYRYAPLDLSKLYGSTRTDVLYGQVSSSSELGEIPKESTLINVFNWKNLTEESVEIQVGIMGSHYAIASRYRDGDLYIDTTVTEIVEGTPEDYTYTTEEIVPVEVTADDDYDFTEFVPSTQFDYYEDKNMMYQFTKNNKQYNLVYKNKMY